MNNYLKKLAYIKRELVKLAAPVSNLEGAPQFVYGPYPGPGYGQQPQLASINSVIDSVVPTKQVSTFTPRPTTNKPSVLESPVQQGPSNINNLTSEQINRIRNYQNALVTGLVNRDGISPDEAVAQLRKNNRYYDINEDGTVSMQTGPKSSLKRFNDIINGDRTANNIKWRGGTVGATPNMSNPTPGSPNARKRPTSDIAQGLIGDTSGLRVNPSMSVQNAPTVPKHSIVQK